MTGPAFARNRDAESKCYEKDFKAVRLEIRRAPCIHGDVIQLPQSGLVQPLVMQYKKGQGAGKLSLCK
jgi:hypothetical protein